MHIIPNWHPFFVHFAVSLILITGLVQLYLLIKKPAEQSCVNQSFKYLIIATAVAVLATIASGIFAYFSVNHDTPSHIAMNIHRNWAIATSLTFIIGTLIYLYKPTLNATVTSSCFIAAAVLVMVTGLKGSDLVYKHGLGVQSMPEVTGEGHDHQHDHDQDPQSVSDDDCVDNFVSDSVSDSVSDEVVDNRDYSEPALVVTGFHEALVAGDVELAKSMLAKDVLIFEGGGVERSAEEYASHHMLSDMKFLAALTPEIIEHQVKEYGDIAVSRARSRLTGTYNNKDYELETMETIVLQLQDGLWKIKDVHWSN
jgi:uncharacterized membrane protein/ketosteroid isomerase-like protein